MLYKTVTGFIFKLLGLNFKLVPFASFMVLVQSLGQCMFCTSNTCVAGVIHSYLPLPRFSGKIVWASIIRWYRWRPIPSQYSSYPVACSHPWMGPPVVLFHHWVIFWWLVPRTVNTHCLAVAMAVAATLMLCACIGH